MQSLVKSGDVQAGLTALRAFLDDLNSGEDVDRYRRETFEIQLFAAELMMATQLSNATLRSSAVAGVDYLNRLLRGLPNRGQMLTYLRRYYDLAVEVQLQWRGRWGILEIVGQPLHGGFNVLVL